MIPALKTNKISSRFTLVKDCHFGYVLQFLKMNILCILLMCIDALLFFMFLQFCYVIYYYSLGHITHIYMKIKYLLCEITNY